MHVLCIMRIRFFRIPKLRNETNYFTEKLVEHQYKVLNFASKRIKFCKQRIKCDLDWLLLQCFWKSGEGKRQLATNSWICIPDCWLGIREHFEVNALFRNVYSETFEIKISLFIFLRLVMTAKYWLMTSGEIYKEEDCDFCYVQWKLC